LCRIIKTIDTKIEKQRNVIAIVSNGVDDIFEKDANMVWATCLKNN
jgi:hypothetical protein